MIISTAHLRCGGIFINLLTTKSSAESAGEVENWSTFGQVSVRVLLTHSVFVGMLMCSVVQFYLKFGCSQQSNLSSSEPVLLRYSADGGIHWSVIGRYEADALTASTYIVVSVPYGAKTNSTRIHWWQPKSDQSHRADWAIDQVIELSV